MNSVGMMDGRKRRRRRSREGEEEEQQIAISTNNQLNKWINFMLPKDYPHFQFIFTLNECGTNKNLIWPIASLANKQTHTHTRNAGFQWIFNLLLLLFFGLKHIKSICSTLLPTHYNKHKHTIMDLFISKS